MYQKQRPLDVGFAAFVQRQTKIHDRIIRLTLMKNQLRLLNIVLLYQFTSFFIPQTW